MKKNKDIALLLEYILIIIPWLVGIYLAKGWLSTLFASLFITYSWYLIIERFMDSLGWL